MKYLRKFATKADMADLEQPNVVLIAESNEVLYNALENGVYIQHIDGKLYTIEDWTAKAFANDVANGVAVVTAEAEFVIAKTDAVSSGVAWGGYEKKITGITTTSDKDLATLDYDGANNTPTIINQLSGYADSKNIVGAPAAEACTSYIFPNGQIGYLPSMGEWQIVQDNKTEVSAALSKIGTTIKQKNYWSSTQGSAAGAWAFYYNAWSGEPKTNLNKWTENQVRAFTTL